jgi:CRISPR-associated protein Cmr5
MSTTRNQKFAAKAYQQVSSLKPKEKSFQDKYGSLAHRLPFLVRSAGLAQALEFVASRGGDEGGIILNHVAENLGQGTSENLRNQIRKAPLNEYMKLTRDVMAALQWYKRFTQSVLDVEPGKDVLT